MPLQEIDEAEGVRAVHRAFAAGINYFDTSPFYGATRSEKVRSEHASSPCSACPTRAQLHEQPGPSHEVDKPVPGHCQSAAGPHNEGDACHSLPDPSGHLVRWLSWTASCEPTTFAARWKVCTLD